MSRAGSVCRDLGTSVKRNKNQLRDYMTTGPDPARIRDAGIPANHVIAFTGQARRNGPALNLSSEHCIRRKKINVPPSK